MSDNMRKFLKQMIAIFSTALGGVIIINIIVIHIAIKHKEDLPIIYISMLAKIVILVVAFIVLVKFVLYLFCREVNYDNMTGLGSRRKLFEDLNKLISSNKQFTVCYIDFNDFKYINDNYGHGAGDALLKEFARRIGSLEPKTIEGYRIGGDEFVIIIKETSDLDNCIQSVFSVTEKDVQITEDAVAKIGFAMGIASNDFDSTAEQLLKRADFNMYKDKRT